MNSNLKAKTSWKKVGSTFSCAVQITFICNGKSTRKILLFNTLAVGSGDKQSQIKHKYNWPETQFQQNPNKKKKH